MALGLAMGRNSPDESNDPCYPAVRRFIEAFSAQFSSISCLELTGVHLGTPEGHAAFRDSGQIKYCTEYVGEATRMVVELIDQN
jgi:hypothetical protein